MRYDIKEQTLGGTLDLAIQVLKDNFRLLIGTALCSWGPVMLLAGLVNLHLLQQLPQGGTPEEQAAAARIILQTMLESFWMFGVLWLVLLLVMPFTAASLVYTTGQILLDRPVRVVDALRAGRRRYPAMLATVLLFYLAVLFSLLVPIIGTILVFVYCYMATPIVVLEGSGAPSALIRSSRLVRGKAIELFGLMIVAFIIRMGLATIPAVLPQPLLNVVFASISNTILLVFDVVVATVFYLSCRCRNEHFDVQILADRITADVQQNPADGAPPNAIGLVT